MRKSVCICVYAPAPLVAVSVARGKGSTTGIEVPRTQPEPTSASFATLVVTHVSHSESAVSPQTPAISNKVRPFTART